MKTCEWSAVTTLSVSRGEVRRPASPTARSSSTASCSACLAFPSWCPWSMRPPAAAPQRCAPRCCPAAAPLSPAAPTPPFPHHSLHPPLHPLQPPTPKRAISRLQEGQLLTPIQKQSQNNEVVAAFLSWGSTSCPCTPRMCVPTEQLQPETGAAGWRFSYEILRS